MIKLLVITLAKQIAIGIIFNQYLYVIYGNFLLMKMFTMEEI